MKVGPGESSIAPFIPHLMYRGPSMQTSSRLFLIVSALLCTGRAPLNAEETISLEPGDRIAIAGGTLAERMSLFGHFEARLHARFPQHQLVVRNLGWSGDEVAQQTRPPGFEHHRQRLVDFRPDVVFALFGFSESFAGPNGIAKFEQDASAFIEQAHQQTGENRGHPPEIVLVSPIAIEPQETWPPGHAERLDANLTSYADALRRVARRDKTHFLDLLTPTRARFADSTMPLTINGVHLNNAGDELLAEILDAQLFGPEPTLETDRLEQIRSCVLAKCHEQFLDYRTLNDMYVYGMRQKPFGVAHFPTEVQQRRQRIAELDRHIWAAADPDSTSPERAPLAPLRPVPVTSSFSPVPEVSSPSEAETKFVVSNGFEVELWASEVECPDLQNPVAFTFDSRGRMWVSTMPSYPMPLPGEAADDKILILEDTDHDGRADRQTIFARGLQLPLGIELGDHGLYVSEPPNLRFLRDTDDDDVADTSEVLLHGFGVSDAHHAISTFEWGPGGGLYFQEGTFLRTQVETPYGTVRVRDGAVYRYEPHSSRLSVFSSYPFVNPWGHVFDQWGQNFIADASDGANYFAAAISGDVIPGEKHAPIKPFLIKQWRPTAGCEIVSSRHFPEEMQGNFLLCNCIGWQGVLRYRFQEAAAGVFAVPLDPLFRSTDLSFCPIDIQIGPDGALYILDWCNPVIGHVQHSLRDPARDHRHGRIWRLRATDRPLLKPHDLASATLLELLELLQSPEDRTRYRVRRELRDRDRESVLTAIDAWLTQRTGGSPEQIHARLEMLWVQQHHDSVDRELLIELLGSNVPFARAAAVRVLSQVHHQYADALSLLEGATHDEHPRVRLEAVRALSFLDDPRAVEVALDVAETPLDPYLEYVLNETLKTLEVRQVEIAR